MHFQVAIAPDRSVRTAERHAIYPNDKNTVNLSKDSSLTGEHQIIGDGVPAIMRFTLNQAQDIMPAIALQSSGNPVGKHQTQLAEFEPSKGLLSSALLQATAMIW